VLIVDDDEGTQETIGRFLTLEGYNVVVASTGKDGLCEAARVASQSVLLDYHLPDIDGLTSLRTLRRQQARTKPSVVLFTADREVHIRAGTGRARRDHAIEALRSRWCSTARCCRMNGTESDAVLLPLASVRDPTQNQSLKDPLE
jgi:CheY-like chemotaxis protein